MPHGAEYRPDGGLLEGGLDGGDAGAWLEPGAGPEAEGDEDVGAAGLDIRCN
jgi:hypothetical protein